MNIRPAVPHTCTRRPAELGSWDTGNDCDTCVAIDSVWSLGYDTGRASGQALARYDGHAAGRQEAMTYFMRCLLLGMLIGIAAVAVANRAKEVAE